MSFNTCSLRLDNHKRSSSCSKAKVIINISEPVRPSIHTSQPLPASPKFSPRISPTSLTSQASTKPSNSTFFDSLRDSMDSTDSSQTLFTELLTPQSRRPRAYSTMLPSPRSSRQLLDSSEDSFSVGQGRHVFFDSEQDINMDPDDEEIKPKELLTLRDSDLKININMVMENLISCPTSAVVYPCSISVQLKEELLQQRPGVDFVFILDLKDRDVTVLLDTFQNFLVYPCERDRISLFTTLPGSSSKRFPLRVALEPTKSEFINEFFAANLSSHQTGPYQDIRGRRQDLGKVLQSSLRTLRNRKYKNHVAGVFVFTDNVPNLDLKRLIDMKNEDQEAENPKIFAFGLGYKHNPVVLQQLCMAFEGKYETVESMEMLHESLIACVDNLNSICAKNVQLKISLDPILKEEQKISKDLSQIIRIAKIYDKGASVEKTARNVVIRKSYFSGKEGINFGLKLKLPEAKRESYMQTVLAYLSVEFSADKLSEGINNNICVNERQKLEIKGTARGEKIDIRALENYYTIKTSQKISEALSRLDCLGPKQTNMDLIKLKKELFTYAQIRSKRLEEFMAIIDWFLNGMQSATSRNNELFKLVKALSG